MKRLIAATALIAAFLVANGDIMDKRTKSFFENRRICVRRDTTTIPGSVISYYQRNGKPDWKMPAVTTNELKKIVGAEQDNPLQADAKKAWKVEKAAAKAKKKDSKNFKKWVSDTEKAKSKSSEDMAEFYDSILKLAHAYENAN